MKKRITIQISIPEPCAQAWDDMQPVQGGRHCANCRQTVMDFTRMTDAALIAYTLQHPVGCGLYREDQLSRDLTLPYIKKSRYGSKWLVALLIMFFGWMKEGMAQKPGSKQKARSTPTNLTPVKSSLKANIGKQPQITTPQPAQTDAKDITNSIQVYQGGNGSGLTIAGARSTSTKYIIDGVQLKPESSSFKSPGSFKHVLPMEPAGRKTIKGDDLPHSFRIEDLQPDR